MNLDRPDRDVPESVSRQSVTPSKGGDYGLLYIIGFCVLLLVLALAQLAADSSAKHKKDAADADQRGFDGVYQQLKSEAAR